LSEPRAQSELAPLARHRQIVIDFLRLAERRHLVYGLIEVRDMLGLTLSFVHDLVDGAPAARFTQRFKALIESGYGLDQLGP
jgi:pyruvate/2-oxoglutarate dehydrogenase complex dihydrolipoamide acyltransferase (E2) component